jgi:hypothetical protein
MHRMKGLVLFLLFVAVSAAPSWGQGNPGFERLKSLVGEWAGKNDTGQAVQVSYRLASRDTVLMETLKSPEEAEMVTVYYPDGKSLMMTHYCPAGNQPRMRAVPATASSQQISFRFIDATNLSGPAAGHMANLAVEFQDNDHFTQRWTWRENSKDKVEAFHFTRQK